jgi:UDP-glucose:(heptosyl)LPS alpha-1,3-glucosyltransferase
VERQLLTGPRPPVVLCLSEYVKAAVRKHYALPEDRLEKLFNGIDLGKFDPARRPEARGEVRRRLGIRDDAVVALIIAQDLARKGLEEALEALANVDPRMMLVVVGKEDPSYYEMRARELKVGERVKFAGATDDPHSFYQAADLFVLPTRHDPCSLVVLEALVMGVPVISTKQNGACEAMTQGVHGFVVDDPTDVAAIAGAMRVMMDDSARARMREACLQLRGSLSQEQHVTRLVQVYEATVQSRRR